MRRFWPLLAILFLAVLWTPSCDGAPTVPDPVPGPPPPPPCEVCACDPALCPPPPPPPPVPIPDVPCSPVPLYPIKTDFLTLTDLQGRLYKTHYVTLSAAKRAEMRGQLKRRGYNSLFQEVIHEKTARYDYLDGEPLTLARPYELRPFLDELQKDCLRTIVGLSIEDAPIAEARYPLDTFISKLPAFVRANDDVIDVYVLAIEINEWLTTAEEDRLGQALRALTSKPIYVHYTKGLYRNALSSSWSSGVFYQWGTSGITESQIRSVTKTLAPQFRARGKRFVAFEYEKRDEAHARRLGRAALAAGAAGAGNGS